MAHAHILGFPRIGAQRELKFAQEAYWRGDASVSSLQTCARNLRAQGWQAQAELDSVVVGDFTCYDQVLNTLALLGAIPTRFGFDEKKLSLAEYFTLARGDSSHFAMEMTKWFDTNYHYLVPEWSSDVRFDGGVDWLYDEVGEAQALGHQAKVVLIGPLSLLHLGKIKSGLSHKLALLPRVLTAYQRVLTRLQQLGVEWVQIDEPILALDLAPEWLEQFEPVYAALSPASPALLLTTYFDDVNEHFELLRNLPVAGVHFDLQRGRAPQLEQLLSWPLDKVLSLGVIDGRNIWRADLDALLETLAPLHAVLAERLWLGSSCSLLHVPVDLDHETQLAPELSSWLAFAVQKIDELKILKQALAQGKDSVDVPLSRARAALAARKNSPRIHNPMVQKRLRSVATLNAQRQSEFPIRTTKQAKKWQLPAFPTTTIGSFPQTAAIRQARAQYKRGALSHLAYLDTMRAEIAFTVAQQEQLGLDVLVHGEAERNDMVEYFAHQLWGYAFTDNGWVQSYGSRCVKPPVIYGDVYRPEAMTVSWSSYAQSLTEKPMKGMLTGPVTMLQWSFVRDDQPRETTALQIALALRDEVGDLEQAGIGMIQIDEPALREGLPLKNRDRPHYLNWAVQAFKISAAGVGDETQIHTHMCYAEFNDILPWIAAMDADVITIETSRSDMELLDAFADFAYPNDIGPGVYDIHAPRVPNIAEIECLLQKARGVIPDARLWVNPDCGLKTRNWEESRAGLANMVQAAKNLRAQVST